MKIINKDQVSYIQIFNETKGVWSSWGYNCGCEGLKKFSEKIKQ